MKPLRHVLLSVRGSHGFEYGVLRDFEREIARVTGAATIPMPSSGAPAILENRIAHGTRFAPLRRYLPRRTSFAVEADVLWVVLMGPEASPLDLYRAWDKQVGYRILYLYDTFAVHLPSVRRLLAAAPWDLAITSFHSAVPLLERETQRPWVAVAQGVDLQRFAPVPAAERSIGFSSYGRRVPAVHETLSRWSDARGVYYDASIAASIQPGTDPLYLYKQYAWHLRRSWFTLSWPVELTHPARAGALSPVTCRWFEAAAAGATMLGRAPADPIFTSFFGEGAVLPLDPIPRSPGETREALASLWERREAHLAAAEARRAARGNAWTWEARVREILALAKLE